MRNLPLVVPNKSELEQSAEILLQGKNLPKSPLDSERLTRRYICAALLPVDFPVGGQICGGRLVFGDVERSATRYVVAPVAGTYVVAGSLRESARRGGECVSDVDINSLQVPTEIQWLDKHIGKTRPAPAGVEAGPRNIRHQLPVGVA